MSHIHYFLAANSAHGFYSLFGQLQLPGRRLYVIKGGPGTGKSSLMKRIGAGLEKAGHFVEYIHCSSDPGSLDGVLCDQLGVGVADGTPPHIIEPRFPGAVDNIINLGEYWDETCLHQHTQPIQELSAQIGERYASIYRLLDAAGLLMDENDGIASHAIFDGLQSFGERLAARIWKNGGDPKESLRFITGITPSGVLTYTEGLEMVAAKRIMLKDPYGKAAALLLDTLRTSALRGGQRVISLYNPLRPPRLDHLILPDLSLGIFTVNTPAMEEQKGTTLHLRRFYRPALLQPHLARFRFNRKAAAELITQASAQLSLTKTLHDKLESYYIPAMDFPAVEALGDRLLEKMLHPG